MHEIPQLLEALNQVSGALGRISDNGTPRSLNTTITEAVAEALSQTPTYRRIPNPLSAACLTLADWSGCLRKLIDTPKPQTKSVHLHRPVSDDTYASYAMA